MREQNPGDLCKCNSNYKLGHVLIRTRTSETIEHLIPRRVLLNYSVL